MTNDETSNFFESCKMSFSMFTRVFRRATFPTNFVTRHARFLHPPRPDLQISRTFKSWQDYRDENVIIKQELEDWKKKNEALKQEKEEAVIKRIEKIREAFERETPLKDWVVNGVISNAMRDKVYFVDLEETSLPLIRLILRGHFVSLYGARATGKTTRVYQVMEKLRSAGIACIYISFEHFNMKTVDSFWSSMGHILSYSVPKFFGNDYIKSSDDFLLKFQKEKWNDIYIVFFIDEFDKLLEANDDIKISFLTTIRTIKNTPDCNPILSVVAIGPFSILRLDSDKLVTSPFNIRERFENPNFTLEQVQTLFKEFENDFKITIDPDIINDIHIRTDGHALLVCFCGKIIQKNLMPMLNEDKDKRIHLSAWTNLLFNSMFDVIYDYGVFSKMIDSLTKKEEARPAVELLRSKFAGFFEFTTINDLEERKLAEYLTAEGALIRDKLYPGDFRIASVFVDEIIRQKVIPVLYKAAPTDAIPRRPDSTLDIIKVLKMSVKFFDKEAISKAPFQSFKVAHVSVEGQKNVFVPRESVYDLELNRILVNWVKKQAGYEVYGQVHLVEHHADKKNKHAYCDVVIKTIPSQTIVLELLATATRKDLNEHFVRVLDYAEKISASEIWIVHFTCEDYTTPYWPSDKRFEKINIAHLFHDRMFTKIQMRVRSVSTSGTFEYTEDVILL